VDDIDQTRLSNSPPSGTSHTSASGWLSSSGSIDHGHFAPGVVVAERYRIIGLIGRGGMGEVYRADDLRLGQQVALKLLPESLAGDPQRVVQFHNEVRTARHVSHPNVCTVYDIGDLQIPGSEPPRHQMYLTMEYVDGEDLSSLLRRIGRLPEDKAIDIARQICAGLSAAHGKGVIHRDLKPANIMLDGDGQVRLMDFGLASIGVVTGEARAGTPAYMAPEQLSGSGVTARSDIFALGLVLYELFTGRRGFQAKTLGELVDLHQSGSIVPPSSLVAGLNPAIERTILRCVAADPDARPASAMAVAAALPGGDPLAAALAAGETPSPQMVAAAGDDASRLPRSRLVGWTTIAVAGLVATLLLSDRLSLYADIPFDRAPATLYDRARDITAMAGGDDGRDRAADFTVRTGTLSWLRQQDPSTVNTRLQTGRPPTVVYWFRSSPGWMVPDNDRVGVDDPIQAPGQTVVLLDLEGRLLTFERLPGAVRSGDPESAAADIDWTPYFEAAGLSASALTPATPIYSPRTHTAVRQAWIGEWPGLDGVELRVEAGGQDGVPVYFRTFGPWNFETTPGSGGGSASIVGMLALLIGPVLLVAAALVVRANLRAGRGDRIGARRLAIATFVVIVAAWLLGAHHIPDLGIERTRVNDAIGRALLEAATLWLFYLAAEPYVRRTWPHILITWERLLAGRRRDPLVGRDLLIGAACGLAMTVMTYASLLMPALLDQPRAWPPIPDLLLSTRDLASRMFNVAYNALGNAMLGVLGLALLRVGLQRLWAPLGHTGVAFAVAVVVFTPLAARGQFQSGAVLLDLSFALLLVVIILGVLFRYGLFAGIVGFFCHFLSWGVVSTLDPAKPFFDTGLASLVVVLAIAVTGLALNVSQTTDNDRRV
jgi:serine/threonine protein kinase